MSKSEKGETAFKAKAHPKRHVGARDKPSAPGNAPGFDGVCFRCNKRGYKQADCKMRRKQNDVTFMVCGSSSNGWLLDSGASSHMTPADDDFDKYERLTNEIEATIADGAHLKAIGKGEIVLKSEGGSSALVFDALPFFGARSPTAVHLEADDARPQLAVCSALCSIELGDRVVATVKRH